MAKRIPLSFKETPEETKLYEEVRKHSCQAAFIKEAIKFFIEHKDKISNSDPQTATKEELFLEEECDGIMDILK